MSDASKEFFEEHWPGLREDDWEVTSPPTDEYNCFAYAVGDEERWWAPSISPRYYWPEGVPLNRTTEALQMAFATVGYTECDEGGLDDGYEKIAIYVNENGQPTHAAKQLESGHWSSKLGGYHDIRHESPEGVGSPDAVASLSQYWTYGKVVGFMRRPRVNRK